MGTVGRTGHGRIIDLPGHSKGSSREGDEVGNGEVRAELQRLGDYVRHGRVDARGLQLSLGGVRAELLRLANGRTDAALRLEDHLQDARERAQRLEALWVRCQAGLAQLAETDDARPARRRRRAAPALSSKR